jgi:hypothetical protein
LKSPPSHRYQESRGSEILRQGQRRLGFQSPKLGVIPPRRRFSDPSAAMPCGEFLLRFGRHMNMNLDQMLMRQAFAAIEKARC